MAGFVAAHGIWSVFDGGHVIPTLAHLDSGGNRVMNRLISDDVTAAVQTGREALAADQPERVRAVLAFDGYVHLDTGKTDAVIVEAVEYGAERSSMTIAVPYRPAQAALAFAVHRPKFLKVTGIAEPDYAALGDAFYAGVDSHPQAAEIWNSHLDQTM